jgi:hypothetical protein
LSSNEQAPDPSDSGAAVPDAADRSEVDPPIAGSDEASARTGLVSLGACLLVSCIYLLLSLRLPLGTLERPGGGLFPVFVGGLGVTFAVAALAIELAQRWRGQGSMREVRPPRRSVRDGIRVPALVAVMASYIFLAPAVGHALASAGVLAVLVRLLRPRPWWQILAFALAFSLGTIVAFESILGMRLPSGRFVSLF